MTPFNFIAPGRLRFGRGVANEAASEVAARGRHVALVRGRSVPFVETLLRALAANGCAVHEITAQGEPTLAQLEAALGTEADVVVAIGGGSVIDLGKALAALIPANAPAMDHLEVVGKGLPLPRAPLPFIAMPTTAGTGAEATKNAVIAVPEHARKVSLRDDRMLPDLALVDPALTDGCPWPVTLASGLDAVTQVIEPYLSAKANPLTDALCAAMIPQGVAALVRLSQREDAQARDALMLCATLSGMALANAGLGAVHGLAGVIGGRCGAPHGAVCGRLLPASLQVNEAAIVAAGLPVERFKQVRGWVGTALGAGPEGAFEALKTWINAQGLPTLAEMGVAEGLFGEIADAAAASSSMKGNPVPLSSAQLVDLMRRA